MADCKHSGKLQLVINYSLFLVKITMIYTNKGHSIYSFQIYSDEFSVQGIEEVITNQQLAKVSLDIPLNLLIYNPKLPKSGVFFLLPSSGFVLYFVLQGFLKNTLLEFGSAQTVQTKARDGLLKMSKRADLAEGLGPAVRSV